MTPDPRGDFYSWLEAVAALFGTSPQHLIEEYGENDLRAMIYNARLSPKEGAEYIRYCL